MNVANRPIIVLGALSVLLAVLCLATTAHWILSFPEWVEQNDIRNVTSVHSLLSGLSIALNSVVLFCGIQFWRRTVAVKWLFLGALLCEIALLFLLMPLGGMALVGSSTSAVITNGLVSGFGIQFLILFPLWAPFVAFRAATGISEAKGGAHGETQLGPERPWYLTGTVFFLSVGAFSVIFFSVFELISEANSPLAQSAVPRIAVYSVVLVSCAFLWRGANWARISLIVLFMGLAGLEAYRTSQAKLFGLDDAAGIAVWLLFALALLTRRSRAYCRTDEGSDTQPVNATGRE